MNQTQLTGITKARLAANAVLAATGAALYADDAAYLSKVCADAGLASLPDSAADSYAAQYSNKTVEQLDQAVTDALQQHPLPDNVDPPKPPEVAGVPTRVTMRQARLALLGAGLLAGIDAVINGLPEPTRSASKIEWEYSQEVQRHNGFVAQIAPALGLTAAQIDSLFTAAKAL